MVLTNYVIRAMGFDDLPNPVRLAARFYGYTVYEMRGLAIAEGICMQESERRLAGTLQRRLHG